MAFKAYKFVGSSVEYWLPDDITVEIAIVPASVTNVRSNQFSLDQTTLTIHETANFNAGANADMHKRWLHNGAGGSSVGFNFVVDDKKIIQLTPLNEVTWAAGTAVGNRTSWHVESCVNSDANLTRTRSNTAALAGAILAAQGWGIGAMVQHEVWYGKNCPMLMRNGGLWPGFVKNTDAFRTQSLQAAKGTPAPAPTPVPTPTPVPDKPRTFTLRFDTYIRSSPGFWDNANNKSNVMKLLKSGTTGTVISGPKLVDGVAFYDLNVPGFGTGWVQDQVLHTLDISAD